MAEEKPNEIKDEMESTDSAYLKYKNECDDIIENKVTDEERIEALFDKLLDFYDEQRFADLFWKLVNYVETYDSGLGAMYRRVEEVLTQGY